MPNVWLDLELEMLQHAEADARWPQGLKLYAQARGQCSPYDATTQRFPADALPCLVVNTKSLADAPEAESVAVDRVVLDCFIIAGDRRQHDEALLAVRDIFKDPAPAWAEFIRTVEYQYRETSAQTVDSVKVTTWVTRFEVTLYGDDDSPLGS